MSVCRFSAAASVVAVVIVVDVVCELIWIQQFAELAQSETPEPQTGHEIKSNLLSCVRAASSKRHAAEGAATVAVSVCQHFAPERQRPNCMCHVGDSSPNQYTIIATVAAAASNNNERNNKIR